VTAKWDEIAENILTAALSTGVVVTRSFVAPGPSFARDCRLVAVVLQRPVVVPLQREWAGGSCAIVPQLTYQVVFVADCVPASDDDGNPPDPAALTTWSTEFLADCQKVHDGITDGASTGAFGTSCDGISIGQGEMRGPLGETASMIVPVTLTPMDAEE
jgi:hypothetical protein